MGTIVPLNTPAQVLLRAATEMRRDGMNGQADGAAFLDVIASWLEHTAEAIDSAPDGARPADLMRLHHHAFDAACAYVEGA